MSSKSKQGSRRNFAAQKVNTDSKRVALKKNPVALSQPTYTNPKDHPKPFKFEGYKKGLS